MLLRGSALALTSLGLAGPAAGAPPALLEQDRGVFTRATASGASEERVDADEAADFGAFRRGVGSSAISADAGAISFAELDSSLAGSTFVAEGIAGVAASASGDGVAEAPADSFLQVIFEASATENFTLAGELGAATGADAYASVKMVDLDLDVVLAFHEVGAGEGTPFFDLGTLNAGTTYGLTAFAVAFAAAGGAVSQSFGEASYAATLQLPEPSGPLGVAVGSAALAALARMRRGRRSGPGAGR